MTITREKFIEATGREPQDDDLERCNCPRAGEPGHLCCGWNHDVDRPQFDIPYGSKVTRHPSGDGYIVARTQWPPIWVHDNGYTEDILFDPNVGPVLIETPCEVRHG